MDKKFLEVVGFSKYSSDDFRKKEITLRDGTDAILWVNKINGHGILDSEYWADVNKDYYQNGYRKEFSANVDGSHVNPEEHLKMYEELNIYQ